MPGLNKRASNQTETTSTKMEDIKKENQQIRATVGGESLCMTCGRVSPLSTQSTFEDLAVDFEGTTASGAERF